ncbi:MAG: hypothetical protein ABIE14_03455 [Patescibacteria group bacterium]
MKDKYLQRLREIIFKHIDSRKTRAFIFGSSIKNQRFFFDVDVGFTGRVDAKQLNILQDELEESTFPYKVDLVDFTKTEKSFHDYVFNHEVKWLN